MARIVLVTGGARSGKSSFAERRLAELIAPPWLYLATAEPLDDEMQVRIAHHRAGRDPRFRTVEAPRDPARALGEAGPAGVLLDCITLWLTNRMLDGLTDASLSAEVDALAEAAAAAAGPVVLVTNELGQGIVPADALARRFRDLAGFANQRLARAADEVVLMACGLPLRLKG